MGKIFSEKITNFSRGMTQDLRSSDTRQSTLVKHFDNISNNHKLVPYRDTEANETKSFDIVKFIQVNSQMYGFGVSSGAIAKIFKKSGDIITSAWTEDQGVNGVGARNEKVFFHYKDFIYFWEAARLTRHGDITATATNSTFQTISFTNVAQPVHHPADDIAYFFYDNIVAKLDGASFTNSVLTLPDNLIITDAEPYGNLLAIACRSKELVGNSVVFLWDRDSSLETVTEKIDWGEGKIDYIANLNGNLVGITSKADTAFDFYKEEVHIRVYEGEKARFVKRFPITVAIPSNGANSKVNKVVTNERMYFWASITVDGTEQEGIYALNSNGELTLDQVEEDADSTGSQGIYKTNSMWWIAHSNDGSVNRTNDQSSLTFTSTYESLKLTGNEPHKTKKLVSVTVSTDSMPSAGQIVLLYKKDEETSYTTIFTNTTNDSVRHSSINIESSGATLPQYKDLILRVESTGGAEPTGIYWQYEFIEDDIYG